MKFTHPKTVTVHRQEACPPFTPAMLALVPRSTSPRGDAIAHIPMRDGRTITEREEAIARRLALSWNCHEKLVEACQLENEINNYIESCDLADDTKHPLWGVVEKLRAALLSTVDI